MAAPTTPAYTPTDVDLFEAKFANLDDSNVAAEWAVSMSSRMDGQESTIPESLRTNVAVKALLDSGVLETKTMSAGIEAIKTKTPKDFLPINGVEALLTPAKPLGNAFSMRQHAFSGEVFLSPANIPHRIYTQTYDSAPTVTAISTDNVSRMARYRVTGIRKGQPVDEELTVPALAA